ncbi:hypothetical protein [Cytophaga aurantiaca]|uniref:hypothetical protein n=1 Tax=Cytophaga aurantiaca TaxID=29530 RepID=UPI0003610471|nr:hypothetical protein [Cytophaga aurantiaca]
MSDEFIIDFFIGLFLANAMPHFILGITKTKFLGPFGFSPAGNIVYAFIQFVISLVLIQIQYGLAAILKNGMLLAAVLVMAMFFIFGKMILRFYNRDSPGKY